jgi:hypothetical protein
MTTRTTLLLASCFALFSVIAQEKQASDGQAFDPFDQTGHVIAGPSTTVEFVESDFDFGKVLQDSENPHVFKFKNTGDVPLVITSAVGSCGCTVPEYDNEPIQPGAESEILVVYKPGKQENDQLKTVTITANTKPSQTLLRIHATVLTDGPIGISEPYTFAPLPPPVDEYIAPYSQLGTQEPDVDYDSPKTTLQFAEYDHDFGQILQNSENPYVFKFKNSGSEPLVISGATGSCGCTVPFYAKDPIMPGEESEIHVVYKPGKQEGNQTKTVTIMANTSPKETILRIKAEVLMTDEAAAPSLFLMDEEQEKAREAIDVVSPGCFVIFPNPTSNELRLDLKEHIGRSADVRIHDQAGKEMLNTRINHISSETSKLDVSMFFEGIYIIAIQVDGQSPMSQCFVVNR